MPCRRHWLQCVKQSNHNEQEVPKVKELTTAAIRNFALTGHAGTGKTSLADLMLYKAGSVSRVGSPDNGTSVSDFRPEEQDAGHSLYNAPLSAEWKDTQLFFCDTPGYQDFRGEAVAALTVADMALICIDAVNGIETGTSRAWKQARDENKPRALFINALDKEQADFQALLSALQDAYGATTVIPFTVPVGKEAELSSVVRVLGSADEVPSELAELVAGYKESLMDTVAESDEELMTKYLEGEPLNEEEISRGLHTAIQAGDIVPVFAGSVANDIGVTELMNGIVNLFPTPDVCAFTCGEETVTPDPAGEALALVFKSVNDPFMGQLTYFRVYNGTFTADSEVHNLNRNNRERFGHLLRICGKQQEQIDQAVPGEIVAVTKLKDTHISDTLSSGADSSKVLPPIAFPQPNMSYAVYPENKGDDEKIGTGLHKMAEEDPTLILNRNAETHELILSGMGDQHLNNIVNRLKSTYKVDVNLEIPKVPYRETITSTGSAQYRHKKQTGGHGQFAEVHMRVEPIPEDAEENFIFESEVVGGNIPKNFIPAVEKGVVETLPSGPLANCQIIRLKAIVYDGKHHPVDSSEMAFKIAARNALRQAIKEAKPILLEPIMKMKIMFPDEYMGDVSGDLNARRGQIMGMEREDTMQVVHAEVPMAESFTYGTQLRSLTHGRGSFELSFERYEPVPTNLMQQIMAEAAKDEEEE